MLRVAKDDFATFTRIHCHIPCSDELKQHVRRLLILAARADAESAAVADALRMVTLAVVLLVTTVAPLCWYFVRDVSLSATAAAFSSAVSARALPLQWHILAAAQVIVWLLVVVVFTFPRRIYYWFRITVPRRITLVWFLFLGLGSVYVTIYMPVPRSPTVVMLTAACFSCVAFALAVFVFMPLERVVVAYLDREAVARQPKASAVSRLLRMLGDMKSSPHDWYRSSFRAKQLQRLQVVAIAFERYYWLKLRMGYPNNDRAIRLRYRAVAASFRDLQMWIAIPKTDTRLHLLERLESSICRIVHGDIDALPVSTSPSTTLVAAASTMMRSLVVAFGPMTLLAVLQYSRLALHAPFVHWVSVAVFVWAVVGVLAAIDPLLAAKIGMMKDVRALLTLDRSGQDK